MTQSASPNDPDRRNVPAREHRWSQAAASYLANTHVTPDTISISGVVATLVGVLLLVLTTETTGITQHLLWIGAGMLTGFRAFCNILDGLVAVEWGKRSPLGALYNEIPDRISDMILLIAAGHSFGGHVTLGYIAAFLAVFTAYVRVAARSVGAPSDFGGPMAKPQRIMVMIATCTYLGLIPDAWHPVWGQGQQYGLMTAALALIAVGSLATIVLRLQRAAHYLRSTHGA